MGKRGKKLKIKLKQQRKLLLPKQRRRTTKSTYFRDNEGNIVTAIELVFPIIRRWRSGDIECIETGFLIHPSVGFVTAKHCMDSNDSFDGDYYGIQTMKSVQVFRRIVYFEMHSHGDIGVGMLGGVLRDSIENRIIYKASLPLAKEPPTIGENVFILGYPRMRISKGRIATFPCDRYDGHILEHRPQGTRWLSSECYITNIDIRSGSSGGPVIRNFKIIGVC